MVDHPVRTARRAYAASGATCSTCRCSCSGRSSACSSPRSGLWQRRRERSTIALLLLGAAFPIGYFFFWGIFLSASFSSVSGPIYLVPLYAPLCILIATVLLSTWHQRRALAIVLVAVLVVATIPLLALKIDQNHSISLAQQPWRDADDSIHGRALVFVEYSGPYLLHLNPFSENPPDLDGRILYATDREAGEPRPDRQRIRGARPTSRSSSLSRDETLTDPNLPVPTITVTRATIDRGATITLHATVTNTDRRPHRRRVPASRRAPRSRAR